MPPPPSSQEIVANTAVDVVPATAVREQLARTRREATRLRRLLRIAEAAAKDRHEQAARNAHHEGEGKGVAS